MFHLLKCQLKSRLSFSFTHFLVPRVHVYVWEYLTVPLSKSLSFCFAVALYSCFSCWESHLVSRCSCESLIPLQSAMILSFHMIVGVSTLVRAKSGNKKMPLFNHEIVITSPQMAFHRPSHFMFSICCY